MTFLSRLAIGASALAIFGHSQADLLQRRETPGCGNEHDFVGETRRFTIESSGGERSYHVSLPPDYEPGTGKPLLIVYHGRNGEATVFQDESQFSNPDINPGMITVFPSGVDRVWQGPSYARADVSDLQFTTDLVRRLKRDFCIDEARIYAVGSSNGGGFVNTLACSTEHGAQFAGFAGVSSALYNDLRGNDECRPARSPLPYFHLHGTADNTIPYNGTEEGRGGPLPNIPNWVGRWAERNQCSDSEEIQLPNDITDHIFTCDGQPGLQRYVKVEGHTHHYPNEDNTQLFATPMILDFLSAQKHPHYP